MIAGAPKTIRLPVLISSVMHIWCAICRTPLRRSDPSGPTESSDYYAKVNGPEKRSGRQEFASSSEKPSSSITRMRWMRFHRVPLTQPEERRLQKRLIKQRDWIFTFMAYPDVPPDNKSSERAIKAAKIKDKVSGGFRSMPGASRFAQLLSPLPNPAKATTSDPCHLDCYLQRE